MKKPVKQNESGRMKTRVFIAPPLKSDATEFVAAASASRKLHASWVSPPLTLAAYTTKVEHLEASGNYGFVVRRIDTHALVGYAEITNVVRGIFLSGYLGYYVFADHARQGFMAEGIRLLARHAFTRLGLHRLEANIQPENTASIALINACGFAKEGYSPRYLKIRGRWRDHERWALLAR